MRSKEVATGGIATRNELWVRWNYEQEVQAAQNPVLLFMRIKEVCCRDNIPTIPNTNVVISLRPNRNDIFEECSPRRGIVHGFPGP